MLDWLTHRSDAFSRFRVFASGASPHGKKCWLYFPEDNCPFYRATVFSLYAKDNCPAEGAALPTLCLGDGSVPPAGTAGARPGPYWSLMFEVSESFMKKVNQEPTALGGATFAAVVKECLQARAATRVRKPRCALRPAWVWGCLRRFPAWPHPALRAPSTRAS